MMWPAIDLLLLCCGVDGTWTDLSRYYRLTASLARRFPHVHVKELSPGLHAWDLRIDTL